MNEDSQTPENKPYKTAKDTMPAVLVAPNMANMSAAEMTVHGIITTQ